MKRPFHTIVIVNLKNFVTTKTILGAILVAFAGISIAGGTVTTESAPRIEPHYTHNGAYSDDASPLNSNQCASCHAFDPIFSHPVGVYPPNSMEVPSHLPLINGAVECLTCHSSAGADHENGRFTISNRLSSDVFGGGLCFECHDSTTLTTNEMHAMATRLAHLPHSQQGSNRQQSSSDAIPDWLDSESDSCMTCHDGALASGSGTISGLRRDIGAHDMLSSEHPIGIYQITNPDADGPLKPSSMVNSRIRLFNNHVGCGSCHSVYSPMQSLLVMSNEGSRLCLGCHEY